jgi:hypothetical protein
MTTFYKDDTSRGDDIAYAPGAIFAYHCQHLDYDKNNALLSDSLIELELVL